MKLGIKILIISMIFLLTVSVSAGEINIEDFSILHELDGDQDIETIEWSPDSRYVASGGKDGRVIIWDVKEGSKSREIKVENEVVSISWSSDDKYMLIITTDNVFIWDTNTWEQTQKDKEYHGEIGSWSPDNQYLALGNDEIKIWAVNDWESIYTIEKYKGPMRSITWSSNSEYLAYCGIDQTSLHIWNIVKKESEVTLGAPNTVASVAWSPDGDYLAVYNSLSPFQGEVYIYKINDWEDYLYRLTGFSGSVKYRDSFSISWSSNSQYLAVSAGGETYIWDNENEDFIKTIDGLKSPIAWSPDGRYIVGVDKSLIIWGCQ